MGGSLGNSPPYLRYYQTPDVWKWQNFDDLGLWQGSPATDGDKRTMWVFEPKASNGYSTHGLLKMKRSLWKWWSIGQRELRCTMGKSYQLVACLEILHGKVFWIAHRRVINGSSRVSYTVCQQITHNETLNGVQTAFQK